jgi:hypothetical protein
VADSHLNILPIGGFAFEAVAAVRTGELADRERETIHDGQVRVVGYPREHGLPESLLDRSKAGKKGVQCRRK